jgi:VanZ family protein
MQIKLRPQYLPALIIMAISFYLSSQSKIAAMPSFRFADKIIHFICFGALAVSWTWWFAPKSWKEHRLRSILLCMLFTSIYGILDEFHQSFVPGRNASFFDWLADTFGAFAGSAAGYFVQKFTWQK